MLKGGRHPGERERERVCVCKLERKNQSCLRMSRVFDGRLQL